MGKVKSAGGDAAGHDPFHPARREDMDTRLSPYTQDREEF